MLLTMVNWETTSSIFVNPTQTTTYFVSNITNEQVCDSIIYVIVQYVTNSL